MSNSVLYLFCQGCGNSLVPSEHFSLGYCNDCIDVYISVSPLLYQECIRMIELTGKDSGNSWHTECIFFSKRVLNHLDLVKKLIGSETYGYREKAKIQTWLDLGVLP